MTEKNQVGITINSLSIGDAHPVRVMGICNLSQESFYKGSVIEPGNIVACIRNMVEEGAEIIDLGGRSTAPKSKPITLDEEEQRVMLALETLFGSMDIRDLLISIDTQHSRVAMSAFSLFTKNGKEGSFILNDVSNLKTDPEMAGWLAETDRPVILMASHKVPGDALGMESIVSALARSMNDLSGKGVDVKKRVIVDPGIGHWIPGKTTDYDIEIIRDLKKLKVLGQPVLAGISRKSFIGSILNRPDPENRLSGTLAATAIAVYNGAHIIRTHDVAQNTMDTIKVASAIK
jgi:dihydropteroate synthase